MYNVDKLPENELRLHRTVARSDAARTKQMLTDLENMAQYVTESDLMSAVFKQSFHEAAESVGIIHNLFSLLERDLTKRIEAAPLPGNTGDGSGT